MIQLTQMVTNLKIVMKTEEDDRNNEPQKQSYAQRLKTLQTEINKTDF